VWNGTVDKRPALIAVCESTADVSAAVRAARELGAPLSVRGGGHQVAGLSVRENGLVVDLSGLRGVRLSDDAATAYAGGGCLLGDVDRGCATAGRLVPAGVVSHTGLGGLALGGGFGWTFRNFGLTCDNIAAAEVVLADGTVVRAPRTATPSCCGRCAAAAATSASSPPSNSPRTRSRRCFSARRSSCSPTCRGPSRTTSR